MFVGLVFFAVLCFVEAKCPAVQVFQGFNASLYLGQWYEIAASPLIRETFERNCYCTNARYGLNANGTVSVRNSCNKGDAQGKPSIINGWASAGSGADAAKLRVHLDGHGGNYWVMNVEINPTSGLYDNAIVWSCESVVVNLEWLWILSRNPTMTQSTYTRLTQLAAKLIPGYDAPNKLTRTVQGPKFNCTYN